MLASDVAAAEPELVEEFLKEAEEAPEEPDAQETVPPSFAEAWKEAVEDEEPPVAAPAIPADFKSFVESVEPEKEEVHVLLQLAELALEGGDAQMALKRYREAAEREPGNADAWTGQGVALQYLERYEEALPAYDRALEIDPRHEKARKWRQTCLRHLGRGRS